MTNPHTETLPTIFRCALIIAVILLTGCADKHWTKPGATAQGFSRDSYECAAQHREHHASFKPFEGYREGDSVNKDLYRACMQSRGYQRVEGGEWIGIRD